MAKPAADVVSKVIEHRGQSARTMALEELKELRKDLTALEKIMSGKRKVGDFALLDVVHSAMELYRTAAAALECDDLMATLEDECGAQLAASQLQELGATLLKKPAGWHWISPKGEMHMLGEKGDEIKALAKLERLKSPRRRKPAKAGEDSEAAQPAGAGEG